MQIRIISKNLILLMIIAIICCKGTYKTKNYIQNNVTLYKEVSISTVPFEYTYNDFWITNQKEYSLISQNFNPYFYKQIKDTIYKNMEFVKTIPKEKLDFMYIRYAFVARTNTSKSDTVYISSTLDDWYIIKDENADYYINNDQDFINILKEHFEIFRNCSPYD